ncbi:MAG: Hsp70 family protein, partial [Lachnospiraceae bacterium]|nr:Hsp70 family protein [Lachnospiraceae bacterium]
MNISIDIGTSYSSVCMQGPDKEMISVDVGTGASLFGSKVSLPSAVFATDDKLLIGQAAMNNRLANPKCFRKNFKRDLGQNFPYDLGGKKYLPEDLYVEFFRHMRESVEKISREEIGTVYITCPATFSNRRKELVLQAAKKASLDNCAMVEEPTAAAMYYCGKGYVKDDQTLLTYDFGGGTFDVALVRYEDGQFRLLTEPAGIENCGGIDIDRIIFNDICNKLDEDSRKILSDTSSSQRMDYARKIKCRMEEMAVQAKEQLSSTQTFTDYLPMGFDMVEYSLSAEELNKMIAQMVEETIRVCEDLLSKGKIKNREKELSAVLLVGGTSRVPYIQSRVQKFAGSVPVYCAPDLELAVSMGALYYNGEEQKKRRLEEIYEKGEDLYQKGKYIEAFQYIREAAEGGNANAQFRLGYMYMDGRGVKQDYVEAVKWY